MNNTKTTPKYNFKYGFGSADLQRMAEAIHYPEHWDIAAYPTLWNAIYEIVINEGCSECRENQ